jgi:hypothetical protein
VYEVKHKGTALEKIHDMLDVGEISLAVSAALTSGVHPQDLAGGFCVSCAYCNIVTLFAQGLTQGCDRREVALQR